MLSTLSTKRQRSSGFPLSAILHIAAFYILVFSPFQPSGGVLQPPPEHKYSVLVLRLEDLPHSMRSGVNKSGAGGSHPSSSPRRTSASGKQRTSEDQGADLAPALADSTPPHSRQHPKEFVLPPVTGPANAKQTLIVPDVPPDIQLKYEIPLVTALLWQRLPPIRRQFVAPVVTRQSPRHAEVPAVPELSAPNLQVTAASVQVAAAIANGELKLLRPLAPADASRRSRLQPLSEPPRIAAATRSETSLTALISLPDSPVSAGQTITIPPANQIASSGSGGSRNVGSDGVAGSGSSNSGRAGGRPAAEAGLGNGSTAADGNASGISAGVGTSTLGGTAPQGSGSGTVPNFASTSGDASGLGNGLGVPDQGLSADGATRLNLPHDGRFSVVVTGSSLAAPYAESVGALSGKMVFSVYVNVGLRKKWILQYCLPKAEEQKTVGKGRVQPIDAPWPYLVVRPDGLGTANRDYVIVQGLLTSQGHLDRLALVFPLNLERNDLLISSLKQWTFRPATRDGVPCDVEILLIIPSQSD